MGLSRKHRAFVSAYLETFNATEAYDRVYHPKRRDAAASNGYKLLRNTEIAEEIDRRLSEDAMRPAEVLKRLAQHGRADVGEFMDELGNVDVAAIKRSRKTGLIRSFRQTIRTGTTQSGEWEETTIDVNLHDAQAALVQIGKAHKLFTDKIEHDGEVLMRVLYGDDGTDDTTA